MADVLDLAGIIPAVCLPMTADGQIDEPALRKYIRWVAGHGIKGVAVNADTGEGPWLYPEERVRVLEIWAEELNGKIPIVAGLSASFTHQAVALAKQAKKAGADALLVFPISAYLGQPCPFEIPFGYHKALAEEVGLPMVMFQIQPAMGGINYTDDMFGRLLEIPQIVAIKEASFNCQRFIDTVRILGQAPRRITILTGNDDFIFESFVLGADGGLLGFATLAIDEQVRMLKLVKQGDILKAQEIWNRIGPLEALIFSPPLRDYRPRIKEALSSLGVIPQATIRKPFLPISNAERERVRQALKQARFL
ncbi:MAG TPA: dihydrodipicolinate synthase family protein [Candidatus Methylomirabilis sp.]